MVLCGKALSSSSPSSAPFRDQKHIALYVNMWSELFSSISNALSHVERIGQCETLAR